MSTLELPSLPRETDSYEQFKATLLTIQEAAAPECDRGFSQGSLRHANADGSYYYFPQPADREEILRFARDLSAEADGPRKSLIVPVGILATHPFEGSGRTSRVYHAMLAGKTAAEIEALGICGFRNWIGTDEQAHQIIDLRPPAALLPHIENYVYESTDTKKRVRVPADWMILEAGVEEYREVVRQLPETYQVDLDEALHARPFNKEFFVRPDDPTSIEFALNAQEQEPGNRDPAELITTMTHLGEDGLKQFVDDMWRFRRLRAMANIACLSATELGSRKVSTQDHETPLAITDQYIRLTNNLVKHR